MKPSDIEPAVPAVGFLRLRPHLQLFREGSDVIIAGDGAYRLSQLSSPMRELLERLQRPVGLRCEDVAEDVYAGVLIGALLERRLAQWSPQPFSDASESGTRAYVASVAGHAHAVLRLAESRVLIVGCGGLGGELARHLVASGVHRLVLVDGDVVSEPNLNRQYLFTRAQLGEPKIEAARASLLALDPHADIEVRHGYVRTEEELGLLGVADIDVVVCCADTPLDTIQGLLARYAVTRGAIFATAGVGVDQGSWGPIMLPDFRPTYSEWREQRRIDAVSSALQPPAASFGPTNSFVAAALAADLIHLLLGLSPPSLHCRVYFDFHTLRVERRPIGERTAA